MLDGRDEAHAVQAMAFPNRSRCSAWPNNVSVVAEITVPNTDKTAPTFSCYSVTTVPVLSNCDDFTYECSGQ